jgi:hypothetical protein
MLLVFPREHCPQRVCDKNGAVPGSVPDPNPIRISLDLLDPHPAPDPDSSINKQKNEEKSRFILFCDLFMTFYL